MLPDEVLELIHSAPERYDSVRAALSYHADGPMRKQIRERIAHRGWATCVRPLPS